MNPLYSSAAKKSGFTLTELMVSLAILSVLLLSLAQAMGYVSQLWIAGVGAVDNFSKSRDILTVMDRDIQQMVLRPDTAAFVDQNGKPACAFYTSAQSSGTDTRAVSLVQYEWNPPGQTAAIGRLTYGMNFTGTLTPIVSSNPAPTALTQLGSGYMNTETLATGVVQFQCQFVDGNGNILNPSSNTYLIPTFTYDFTNPRNLANPRAVVISIAVLSNSAYNLATQSGTLAKLTDGSSIFSTTTPTNQTFSQVWNGVLTTPNAAFLALPPTVRLGARVFQRYIPLPLVTPQS